MKQAEGTFKALDGLALYYRTWLPEHPVAKLILILHGWTENSAYDSHWVDYFIPRGVGVFSLDLRGCGRSAGQAGYIDRFSQYREDVHLFIDRAHLMHPECDLYLLCSGLGALVAADYLQHYPSGCSAAVLSALPIDPLDVAAPFKTFMAKSFSGLFPHLSFHNGSHPEAVAGDPQESSGIQQAPQTAFRVTARWVAECLRAVEEVKGAVRFIHTPLMLVSTPEEKASSPDGMRIFFSSIPYEDKVLKIYPSESAFDVHMQDVADWIDRHSSFTP